MEDDRSLVARIIRGDEAAFEAFLARYERRIFGLGMRMCGHRHDAEDMVQDVFLSALKGLSAFRWEVPVLSWLFRIAAHRCQRMRRLRSGQPRRMEELDAPRPDGARLVDPRDKGPDSLADLIAREERARLERAIRLLPPDLRLVLVLRDMEEQSTQEAAGILGLSQAAVKSRLHRARMALKKEVLHAKK